MIFNENFKKIKKKIIIKINENINNKKIDYNDKTLYNQILNIQQKN